jgi:hypothetical protein
MVAPAGPSSGTGTPPTTYYVDNSCTNNGNGLATSCAASSGAAGPFNSIINSESGVSGSQPGSSFLLKAGETFREEFDVQAYGTSAGQFTIGSYGSGAAPILNEANVFSSWTVQSGALYHTPYTTAPKVVVEDGVPLVQNLTSYSSLTAGQWFLDTTDQYIWVYTFGGDSPAGHTMEASQRNYGINGESISYVTVNGLNVEYAGMYNIFFYEGNNITVENSTSYAAYYYGIYGLSTSGNNNNWLVTGNTVNYNGGNGIFENEDGSNWEISQNSLSNNAWGGSGGSDTMFTAGSGIRIFGAGGSAMTNGTIERNKSCNNGLGPTGAWSTYGVETGAGIMLDTVGTGFVIRYNYACNNEIANIRVTVDGYGSQVYGNVSYGNTNTTTSNYGIGIQVFDQVNGTKVYNNTSVGNIVGLAIEGISSVDNSCLNVVVTNNISTGNTTNLLAIYGGANDGTYGSGNTYTYNSFGTATSKFIEWGAATYKSTYSAWETATGNCGSTGCSYSIQTTPTFTNAGSGILTLVSGSSAIGSGTNLGATYQYGLNPSASWPSSVTIFPQGLDGTWDVGAFVFVQ